MMALRRFATRKYSLGRVADAIYSSLASVFTWILLSAAALVAILLAYEPEDEPEKVDFLSFISLDHIHDAGIGLVGLHRPGRRDPDMDPVPQPAARAWRG